MRQFITLAGVLAASGVASAAFNLQVTEIWQGQDGADVTADWFEITNFGDMAWELAVDGGLFYDDVSADTTDATAISGITSIGAGQSVIVTVGLAASASTFFDVWSPVANLAGVQIGWTDGAGLGQGGDAVNIWIGDLLGGPDFGASYPSVPSEFDGASYDVLLGAFSTIGNASGAVASSIGGGDFGDVFAVASPGSIPAPGAVALFGVAGLAARRRR